MEVELEVGGIKKKDYICKMKNNKEVIIVIAWFVLITVVALLVT